MPGGTLLLATLGFHEHFALRRLSMLGAGRGDYVAAVTVKPPASAVRAAWESLRGLAARLGVTPLEILELDPADLEAAVAELIEWVDEQAASLAVDRVVIDATGGSRVLTAATLLAAIPLSRRYNLDYYIQSDTGEAWQARITSDLIDLLLNPPTPERLRVLKYITENPGASSREISEATGIRHKTVLNTVTKLKKQKLVTQKGRSRGLYPTTRAKLALALQLHNIKQLY